MHTNKPEPSRQDCLIARGVCTFSVKILNAQAANAIGVIVYNSHAPAGDPIAMSFDTSSDPADYSSSYGLTPNGLAMAAAAPSTVTSMDESTRILH